MSNVHEFLSVKNTRSDEAGLWFAKLQKGLSDEQEKALLIWLSHSGENYRELMEMTRLWDKMDALSRLADIFPQPVSRPGRVTRHGWKIAASLLVVIGAATAWFGTDQPFTSGHTEVAAANTSDKYETALGEQSVFYLIDGTKIALNTNSLVTVNFTEKNRLLRLERGEMHVSVAHNPLRPLSVIVGDSVIQAVGTAFNIEITNDQGIELVVTEGLVMVGILNAPIDELSRHGPVILQSSSVTVAAGQAVVIDTAEEKLESIEIADIKAEEIAVKLSWREGNLIFRGEYLEDAVSEIGRYTAVEFVFLDEESRKVRLAGLFKAGDVEGLLEALRDNFNISYERVGEDKIILSGR